MTEEKEEIVRYMEECERQGRFDVHTTPPELNLSLPVDEKYAYLRKGPKYFFPKTFVNVVSYFKEKKIIRNLFELEVIGEENLKGIPNSMVVCNHVHMFDCVIVRHVYKRKNIYITAAEFNNRSDFLGFLMRYLGMMPFSSNKKAMKNMNRAIKKVLTGKEGHILFYPEASEWWYYKKPRPFKVGAFHYAVQYNVPVQPMFITFEDIGKQDADGNPLPKATLHILPAIYGKADLKRKEKIKDLSRRAFEAMKAVYEETYGEALVYSCDEVKESGVM